MGMTLQGAQGMERVKREEHIEEPDKGGRKEGLSHG